jgi:hypothetical protein
MRRPPVHPLAGAPPLPGFRAVAPSPRLNRRMTLLTARRHIRPPELTALFGGVGSRSRANWARRVRRRYINAVISHIGLETRSRASGAHPPTRRRHRRRQHQQQQQQQHREAGRRKTKQASRVTQLAAAAAARQTVLHRREAEVVSKRQVLFLATLGHCAADGVLPGA